MKIRDLIIACLQNLSRHKVRTLLTVLGIIVDCCFMVIMISVGIGMKDAQEKALTQMGNLSVVQVYPTGKKAKSVKLNIRVTNKIRELREMEITTPKSSEENIPITVYGGKGKRYKADYVSIMGINLSVARAMDYKLTQGDWQPGKKDYIYTGRNFTYMLEDIKRPQEENTVDMYGGEWDGEGMPVMPPPYLDITRIPVTMELDGGKEDGKRVVQALKATGRLKEDFVKSKETSIGLLTSLEMYQSPLGQQVRLAGKKWDSHKGCQSTLVKVKDIRDVAQAGLGIKKMGFRTSSIESTRKPMEQEVRQRRMVLGGLGTVSLFVVALGITNTMIMSISERTRETGVMKSLGYSVKDIRKIFLLEAGYIGLLGSIAGLVLSYGISVVMNLAATRLPVFASVQIIDGMAGIPSHLSVIPWWLSLLATLFLAVIGMGADCCPASRVVGIPALEATKHD